MALGGTQAANADNVTGMDLQRWCSAKAGSSDSLICSAYTLGFIHGLSLDTAQKAFCLPRGLTAGQARLITEKFMSEHPEDLHKDASVITARALYIAYACKRSDEAGR
jgi:hypothetical protein